VAGGIGPLTGRGHTYRRPLGAGWSEGFDRLTDRDRGMGTFALSPRGHKLTNSRQILGRPTFSLTGG
jgi:hypothetical protein